MWRFRQIRSDLLGGYRRNMRKAAAAALASVLVFGLGGCADSPEKQAQELVERYLQAIVDGRAADAAALAGADQTDAAIVPDEALRQAEQRIDGFTIEDVTSWSATVTVTAGEESREASIMVDLENESVSDPWLWRPMGLYISLPVAQLTMNDVVIPTSEDGGAVVLALPGVYHTSAEAGPLVDVTVGTWELGLQDSMMDPTSSDPISATLNEAGQAEADRQFQAIIDRCLEDRTGRDTSCPNQLFDYYTPDPGSVEWTLLAPLEVEWDRPVAGYFIGSLAGDNDYLWAVTWTENGEPQDWLGQEEGWTYVGSPAALLNPDHTLTVEILGAE